MVLEFMSFDIAYDVENSRIPGNQLDRAGILIRCDIVTSQIRGDGQQSACFPEAKGVPRRQRGTVIINSIFGNQSIGCDRLRFTD
jgi:hypothetical protein